MLYENKTGKDAKIKIMDKHEKLGFRWITARVGDVVDIPREVGENERFTPAKGKGIIDTVKNKLTGKGNENKDEAPEETKETDEELYKKKLHDIKGIGARTVLDIIEKYPTEDALVMAIDNKDHLPFRNDQCELLKDAFGSEEENGDEEIEDDKK